MVLSTIPSYNTQYVNKSLIYIIKIGKQRYTSKGEIGQEAIRPVIS
jgi:hypothetical protein